MQDKRISTWGLVGFSFSSTPTTGTILEVVFALQFHLSLNRTATLPQTEPAGLPNQSPPRSQISKSLIVVVISQDRPTVLYLQYNPQHSPIKLEMKVHVMASAMCWSHHHLLVTEVVTVLRWCLSFPPYSYGLFKTPSSLRYIGISVKLMYLL